MANIYESPEELIGKTPLIRLGRIEKKHGLKAELYAKIESLNLAGSVKDRVAKRMLDDAEKRGKLKLGSVIIEPTSGNTGIGLAALGRLRGYRVIIVMPSNMSKERIALIKAYGAEVILTDAKDGMSGSIKKAEELAKSFENSFIPSQFDNPENPMAHYLTTGPEIYEDTDGNIDVFVAGIGTGGTVSGVGKYLKEKNPSIKVVGVEPADSAVLTGGIAGPHKIQGIGAGFIPNTLNLSVVDEIITATADDAFLYAKELSYECAILVGISSGAALYAAVKLALREENENKKIVVLLPDGHDRYLSSELYSDL